MLSLPLRICTLGPLSCAWAGQFPQGSTGTESKAKLASELHPQSPMGLEGQEAKSSGICSQLVAPTGSTAPLLAPLLQRMKASGPWDLLHLGPHGQRGSPEDGCVGAESRSVREDVTALLPSLWSTWWPAPQALSSLRSLHHSRLLTKRAGSGMSPQTRTGKALLQPSGPTCPQTEVSCVPAGA